MIKNYFIVAFRNLWRHRVLSGINLFGLAIGIACCLLIALYVFHETTFDRFNKNANRIVRVTMEFAADGVPYNVAVTGTKVYPAFKRAFPEVEDGVRIYPSGSVVEYADKIFEEKKVLYADSSFFRIFSFPLLQGDPSQVLNRPNQVVITESVARKYFGDPAHAIGKLLKFNNKQDLVVTGVAADCPARSQIKFSMVASFYTLTDEVFTQESYYDASHYTYLLLHNHADIKKLAARIPAFMRKEDPNNVPGSKSYLTFHLQPLTDVHLYSRVEGGLEPSGDYRYVYIFSIIAFLILGIAGANYVNLSTARASERAREVGVRKVMGALRAQLFRQFILESVLIVLIALVIGILLARLGLPGLNRITERQLSLGELLSPALLAVLGVLVLVLGFLGGAYPALLISGFQPVRVLKGSFSGGHSGAWLRKSLIVLQFSISIALIVSTLIIHKQISYIRDKKLGYNRNQVLVLPLDDQVKKVLPSLKSEMLSNAGISGVTTCSQLPTYVPGKYNMSVGSRDMIVTAIRTDKDFIPTMEMKLVSGSDFSESDQLLADSIIPDRPVILNETAARTCGWTSEQAIGKRIKFQGRPAVVKGVVADFHYSSMHDAIGPLVLFIGSFTRHILVRVNAHNLPESLSFVKQKWQSLIKHRPFEYEFLNDQFNQLYKSETRTGQLFYAFALLAIVLACLGLLGLVTFMAHQRVREIGIRRVLGATVPNIVGLLSRDFLKLVILASVISIPIAAWAMHRWLDDFAYRVQMGWVIFVIAFLLALVIAMFTTGVQAARAAYSNPVKSLRNE